MVQNKKKVSLWFIVLGAVLSAYAGYLLNGAWEPGMEMNAFLESVGRVCAEPFANYYNETTLKAVVIANSLCYRPFNVYHKPAELHAGEGIWNGKV